RERRDKVAAARALRAQRRRPAHAWMRQLATRLTGPAQSKAPRQRSSRPAAGASRDDIGILRRDRSGRTRPSTSRRRPAALPGQKLPTSERGAAARSTRATRTRRTGARRRRRSSDRAVGAPTPTKRSSGNPQGSYLGSSAGIAGLFDISRRPLANRQPTRGAR